MSTEIERKFLLPEPPQLLHKHAARDLVQGYLAIAEDVEVRLRRSGEDRLLTVKRGKGETREEVEIELVPSQFEQLWGLTESARVTKRRFEVPLEQGRCAEVDVYAGELAGLVVAEVEFPSRAASHSSARLCSSELR